MLQDVSTVLGMISEGNKKPGRDHKSLENAAQNHSPCLQKAMRADVKQKENWFIGTVIPG